ncbi:MAG TPA: sulfotransferase domain-containing protein [Caulobacteraceae bacterium]
MSGLFWLASYPKSGNTWFRMLVNNLSAADGPADINEPPESGGGIASMRAPFDFTLLIESGLLTGDEIDALRPRVHELMARGGDAEETDGPPPPFRLLKVHDAYGPAPNGEPLLAGARGAAGAIVIVRDPRDVAPSLANHHSSSISEAIDFMGDPGRAYCAQPHRQPHQLRQKLGRWSDHVAGWIDQKDVPVCLIRYEDMVADTAGELARALGFAGRPASEAEIARAVAQADFAELQRQERATGFAEAPRDLGEGALFFRRGEVGAWRDELTAAEVSRIEAAHGPMMRRLGYELAGAASLAPTG